MTTRPTFTPARTWRTVARGLAAVAVLLLGAADALVTAAAGVPPIAWCARRLGGAVRAAYRIGRYSAPSTSTDIQPLVFEGEIVTDEENGR